MWLSNSTRKSMMKKQIFSQDVLFHSRRRIWRRSWWCGRLIFLPVPPLLGCLSLCGFSKSVFFLVPSQLGCRKSSLFPLSLQLWAISFAHCRAHNHTFFCRQVSLSRALQPSHSQCQQPRVSQQHNAGPVSYSHLHGTSWVPNTAKISFVLFGYYSLA